MKITKQNKRILINLGITISFFFSFSLGCMTFFPGETFQIQESKNSFESSPKKVDNFSSRNKYKLGQSTEFIEILSRRSQTSRHFYNQSSDTFRYESDQLIYNDKIFAETNWITYNEFPIKFIIRLTNGSIFKFQDLANIATFFTQINNNSLWGLGVESFNGIMGFYTDFTDLEWGHGQYIYYPRLKNGSLPNYKTPLYSIYPHLFINTGGTWFDTLLNNRSFYSGANDPRNHLTFINQSNEIGLFYQTNNVDIDGFNWHFQHGFKYNTSDRQYHMITRFVCTNKNWQNIGMAYDITVSPQAKGTSYESEKFILQNTTHEKIINISTLWKANESIIDPLNRIEIVSKNGESFSFDFSDMKAAGFNKSYLELHNQILPNGLSNKTLLVGMYDYGAYIQNTAIEIDPTFSEKQTTDELDFQTTLLGSEYTANVGQDYSYVGFRESPTRVFRFSISYDLGITDTITNIENASMSIYVNSEWIEPDEYVALGIYYNETLYKGYWNESYAEINDFSAYSQTMFWNVTNAIIPTSFPINYSIPTVNLEYGLNNWTTIHNIDPAERTFISFRMYNGAGMDADTDDFIDVAESSEPTTSQRPTLIFDYTTDIDSTIPNITIIEGNQTILFGSTGDQVQWQVWDENPANYSIYRNETGIANGTYTNAQLINQSLDGLSVGLWNFTLFVNDTSSNSNTSTVWIIVQVIPPVVPGTGVLGLLGFDWVDLVLVQENIIYETLSQEINLEISGTLISPNIVSYTEDFDYITSITWTLKFNTDLLNITKFALNNSLTNGINVFYDGISILGNENITQMNHFSNQEFSAYKFVIMTDEINNRILLSRWVYLDDGLRVNSQKIYEIYVQDDLSGLTNVTDFYATIEGYKIITNLETQDINSQDENPFPIVVDLIAFLEREWLFIMGMIFILVIFLKKVF